MFVLFLVLTILSLILLVVGAIWMLAGRGQTTRRSGRDVGAEIMNGIGDDGDGSIPVVEKSFFVGKGIQLSRSAEISYVEIKQLVRERQWRAALPFLMAMIGMFGLFVFGVLALWVKMDDKLVATLIAGVVLFTMGRIAWNISRA
jgi:hypothetical protein